MKRIPLNFGWKRKYVDDQLPYVFDPGGGETVDLPDDFVLELPRKPGVPGGAATGFFPSVQGKYTKEVEIPPDWEGKKVFLSIDGAYMNTELTLDGERLDMHPYGYTPYVADLTHALAFGKSNVIGITTQARQPSTRWYSGGGLYRGVELWVGESCYIDPREVYVTTPDVTPERARIHVSLKLTNTCSLAQTGSLQLVLTAPSGAAAAETDAAVTMDGGAKTDFETDLYVSEPLLWDSDTPNLYTLHLSLCTAGQAPDAEAVNVGIREITIDPQHGMQVNGKSVKLRGGCLHHDNGFLGARAFPRAEERKIQLLKELGYNAIRTAHNPPSEALLDACDRLGMYVMDETFDCWRSGKNSLDYHLYFEDWWERDVTSTILRDRNHPSVFCWSCGNEIAESNGSSNGEYWLSKLIALMHDLDPSRPATCGGMFLPYPKGENFVLSVPPGHDEDEPLPGPGMDLGDRELPEEELRRRADNLAHTVDILSLNYEYDKYDQRCGQFPDRAIIGTESMGFYTWENWQAVNRSPQILGDFIWTAIDNLGEAGAGRVERDERSLGPTLMGPYPWLSCFQGDLDLTGRRLPRSYYRKIMWGFDHGVHLFVTEPKWTNKPFYGMGWHWPDLKRSWTFPDKYIGRETEVVAYADCDRVEFYCNDRLVGQAIPEKLIASCVIPYQPGKLCALAYKNGVMIAEDTIVTTGKPARILLEADRLALQADGMDLSYITASIADANGEPVVCSDVEISAHVSGCGKLAGIGSGNPCTEENFGTGRRFVYNGTATLCVRAGRSAGEVQVTVTAPNLPAAQCTIRCTETP